MAKRVFAVIVRPDTPEDVTVILEDGSIDVMSRASDDGSDLVEFFQDTMSQVEFW